MHVPTNPERMQTISEIVAEKLEAHVRRGGTYYDDGAEAIAAQAIHTCMPQLPSLLDTRVTVAANSGLSLVESNTPRVGFEAQHHQGIHVIGGLGRVSIQTIVSTMGAGPDALQMSRYDLFAVIKPRYMNPDPVDIVFGNELCVPFSGVTRFEPAA